MFIDHTFPEPHYPFRAPMPPMSAPPSPAHSFDALDDVFGSAPSSPLLNASSDATIADATGILDSSNGTATNASTSILTRPSLEPSDVPRLRSAHSASGYRDGIAAAKATVIQEGFDEGYTLGAVIGLKVGRILGVLDGILGAVAHVVEQEKKASGEKSEASEELERLCGLVVKARKELSVREVYAKELWGADGIWTFEVQVGSGAETDGDGEITFKHVAAAHPGLKKWEAIAEQEVQRWELQLGVLEDEAEDGGV